MSVLSTPTLGPPFTQIAQLACPSRKSKARSRSWRARLPGRFIWKAGGTFSTRRRTGRISCTISQVCTWIRRFCERKLRENREKCEEAGGKSDRRWKSVDKAANWVHFLYDFTGVHFVVFVMTLSRAGGISWAQSGTRCNNGAKAVAWNWCETGARKKGRTKALVCERNGARTERKWKGDKVWKARNGVNRVDEEEREGEGREKESKREVATCGFFFSVDFLGKERKGARWESGFHHTNLPFT